MIYEIKLSEQADKDLIYNLLRMQADSLTVWKNIYQNFILCLNVIQSMKKNLGKAVNFEYYLLIIILYFIFQIAIKKL